MSSKVVSTATIIGSGPNGLSAVIALAAAGLTARGATAHGLPAIREVETDKEHRQSAPSPVAVLRFRVVKSRGRWDVFVQ